MTHTYQVTGITCASCEATVKSLLEKVPGVTAVTVNRDGKTTVTMSHHIITTDLQSAFRAHAKYQLQEIPSSVAPPVDTTDDRSFFQTYKPILLIFAFITGTTLLTQLSAGDFNGMEWMRHFMAGFFLVFSFFKLLDVPAFAMSYSSYDIVAKRWFGWGYIYPFVELLLGILFLVNADAPLTNLFTLIVMGVSTIGVVQSILQKRRFQCACLGAVFNLPMSHITLFEDLLMVAMALTGLLLH
jgi:copper chaperone CopZ